eukprot:671622-Pelagomonas_calceolata.AAC.4
MSAGIHLHDLTLQAGLFESCSRSGACAAQGKLYTIARAQRESVRTPCTPCGADTTRETLHAIACAPEANVHHAHSVKLVQLMRPCMPLNRPLRVCLHHTLPCGACAAPAEQLMRPCMPVCRP